MTDKQLRAHAKWIAAIGEPTRLRIVRALAGGEKGVSELAKSVVTELVNASQHLGVLKAAGVVTVKRDGRFMRYSLRGATATAMELVVTHESGVRVVIGLN